MPDSIEKLKEIVRELESELHELPAVDEQAAELLQEAIREIQMVLQSRQFDARRPSSGDRNRWTRICSLTLPRP
jgi:hypothetical protein